MNDFSQRKYSAKYRLMYDYGEGPVVVYEAYDEQDAIQEKKRLVAHGNIYPVIFRSNGREQPDHTVCDSAEREYS